MSVFVMLAACESRAVPAKQTVEPARAEVAKQVPATTPRHFGAPPKLAGPPTPVAELLTAPEPYLGKTIKCEGKVARVCQNAGCWLELQATEGGEGLRVPMAGHAFFIPQDAVGQLAVVEGALRRSALPAAQREHYKSEGMQATGPLALDATSVSLR